MMFFTQSARDTHLQTFTNLITRVFIWKTCLKNKLNIKIVSLGIKYLQILKLQKQPAYTDVVNIVNANYELLNAGFFPNLFCSVPLFFPK
jgi:hypothetical protein